MSLSYQTQSWDPQALSTGLTLRLAKDPETAIVVNNVTQERSAKRNAQQINYAEFEQPAEEFDMEEETAANAANPMANTHNALSVQKHMLKPARLVSLAEDMAPSELQPADSNTLIPIKLSIEYSGGSMKLVDHFMWNPLDPYLTPSRFAALLVTELELPLLIQSEIVSSINKQIEENQAVTNAQLPDNEYHVIVDLSVNLNRKLYEDKFEWDLKQTDITPEDFADILVADMGLSLEFRTAIAHSLHEMILRLKKDLLEGSYNLEMHKHQQLSGLIFERNIRIRTDSSINNGNATWEPVIEVLSQWEIEKRDLERERNFRRLKRENMRRDFDDLNPFKRRTIIRRRADDLL
ncbi:hypothetical protein PUMCH_003590 [Australozyma saopauloensis]|uniref:Chromatin structure-remodeling complex subunit SFH1 n=1 Tax=Australozyma saopauloensis TaxID=291208 RepID=A0AAX4HCU9_9ASCO|nr:hypothetical protein PUMCH_003590 [[Candida] saopauloensis]